ncbi:MAG TPA: dipeptidase [Anaerolineae bacterium]|nr:dipeptidase [Anaerolineae bacterium]
MPAPEAAVQYAKEHKNDFLEDLITLLRIPSVSTLPDHQGDMERAAAWISDRLKSMDFDNVRVMPTDRHPVVYGECLKAGKSAPTLLFYGHYDVQPADPLEEWKSDPFDPQIRGDDLFARGASDMKAQVVAHLSAAASMVHTSGLPINVKYMIEGEEEIGSPSLEKFIIANKDLLSCDICLNADCAILAPDTPSITYALRGLAYFEIRIQGPASDLHSGRFGGAIDNPALVLSELIAGMRDENGRITLPGFYDSVRDLSDDERAELSKLPTDDAWWQAQAGVKALHGERGYSAGERASARPTLDVNGLLSGFTGEGSKTVLPAKAMAKISMRLVSDQTPEQVHEGLIQYMKENAPPTITWEVEKLAGAPPAIVERDSVSIRAASKAFESVWGKRPLFTREGGTVPVVGMIQNLMGVDCLMMGFGLPDDNLHAPNEKQHLPNYYRGIETFIRFTHELAV